MPRRNFHKTLTMQHIGNPICATFSETRSDCSAYEVDRVAFVIVSRLNVIFMHKRSVNTTILH